MYITGDDGYQNFSVLAPIRNSLTFDSNKEVIYWISTGILSENIKPFDSNLEPTIPVLSQKSSSSLYSSFILNLYIVYALNN